jgi:hypothetical protein
VLHLPDPALSHDYLGSVARPITNYLEDNVQRFFEFARDRRGQFPDVKKNILVTEYTVTTSWAAAVFLDKNLDTKLEFQSLPKDKMNFQWHIKDNIREHVWCDTSNPTQICSLGLILLTRTDSIFISIQRMISFPTNASTSVAFKQALRIGSLKVAAREGPVVMGGQCRCRPAWPHQPSVMFGNTSGLEAVQYTHSFPHCYLLY